MLNTHGSLLGFKKYLPAGLQRIPYQAYDVLTLKTAARKSDAVVVSSRLEYEDAVEFGIPREKLHVIPMGIDIEAQAPATTPENGNGLNLLFVGRLARVRRVELLLQALQRLPEPWRLTVVGGEEKTNSLSRPGYLGELLRLCADLGIEERVTFAGPKSPREVKTIYQTADVFVYPSLYENFAQPVLEAAAAGLPVVATGVGVVPEIVVEGETGFIVPGDPQAISNRIGHLADGSTRRRFGRKLQETVRQNYGWNQIIQRYMELYRSL